MSDPTDIIGAVLILSGAALGAIAGVGQARFSDLFTRMHVATKPATLGLLLICVGAALLIPGGATRSMLFLIVVLQFATAPVAAHLVGRAAHRHDDWERSEAVVDDLRDLDDRPPPP